MTTANPRRNYDDAPRARRVRRDDVATEPRAPQVPQRARRSFLARFAAGATAPVSGRFELIVL